MSLMNGETTYTWIIKNYSFCDKRNECCLRSPNFTVDDSDSSQWSISIYPRGSQSLYADCVSLHLLRRWPKLTYKKKVDFSVELCYRDEVLFTLHEKDAETPPVCGRTLFFDFFFQEAMKTKELEEKMKKNAKDCLMVRCRFTFDTELMSKKSLFTRTVVGANQFSFVWDVEYRTFSEWIVMKKFAIFETHFEIIIKAPKDDILIEIRKAGNESVQYCRVKCKLTLLIADGKGPSKCDSFLFDSNSENNIWYFPSFFKRSSLGENYLIKTNKYFSGKTIKLKCNFSVSNGSIESESDLSEAKYPNILSSLDVSEVLTVDSLQFDMRNLLLSKKYADVQFRIDKEVICSHKNILASRSPVFSAMFEHDMIENQTGTIDISDMKLETMKLFLVFLYTDILEELDCKNALELLLVADKYQVPSLKEECSQFLSVNLDHENICGVVSMADMLGHAALKTAAIDYVKIHAANILGSPKWVKWVKSNVELGSEILCMLSS